MMGVITIFRESSFIFSLVSLITWGWVHIWGDNKKKNKNKMSKDKQESFYNHIKMNHLT